MKILITGATGLVGRHIVAIFISKGWEVNILSTQKNIVPEANCKAFYWNPDAGIIDLKCFEGVEAVVHLAGEPIAKRWTKAYKRKLISSRVDSVKLLYKSIKKNSFKIAHFISASAIGIYPSSLTAHYKEEDICPPHNFLSKLVSQWERVTADFKKLQIDVTVLRLGLVLSDKGGVLMQIAKPIRLGLGSVFGSGKQWQSWIHIKDLGRLFAFVVEHKLQGTYNAVSPNPVSHSSLVSAVAKELDVRLCLPKTPKFVMHLVLGEMKQLLYDSQYVSAEKIVKAGFQFRFNTLEVALSDLLSSKR